MSPPKSGATNRLMSSVKSLEIVLDPPVKCKDILLQIRRNRLALGLLPPKLYQEPAICRGISQVADLLKLTIEVLCTEEALERGLDYHNGAPGGERLTHGHNVVAPAET